MSIKLTQGKRTYISIEDYALVSGMKWQALQVGKGRWYAVHAYYKAKHYHLTFMHRLLTSVPKGMVVDHKDHDTLNNVKSNLRICTGSQNQANMRKHKDSQQKYKGISKKGNRWWAQIRHNYTNYYLGSFTTPEDAARAYNTEAVKRFGEFALLNKIEE